jgi:hypothetical protein
VLQLALVSTLGVRSIRSRSATLSGAECVIALWQLGFEILRREPGRTILRGGHRFVVVPDVLVLPAEVLDRIIVEADVSYGALLRAIEEVPTEPEISVLEA